MTPLAISQSTVQAFRPSPSFRRTINLGKACDSVMNDFSGCLRGNFLMEMNVDGVKWDEDVDCEGCDAWGHRAVATGELVQLLPIYPAELEDGLPVAWQPHIAPKLDSPQDPQPLLIWWGQDGDRDSWRTTDISHLRDLAPWAESQWAGIITGLEIP